MQIVSFVLPFPDEESASLRERGHVNAFPYQQQTEQIFFNIIFRNSTETEGIKMFNAVSIAVFYNQT